MVAVAENRVATFNYVKEEIDTRMADVHERLDGVKSLIKENVQSTDNPTGVLTKSVETYMDCLSLGHV